MINISGNNYQFGFQDTIANQKFDAGKETRIESINDLKEFIQKGATNIYVSDGTSVYKVSINSQGELSSQSVNTERASEEATGKIYTVDPHYEIAEHDAVRIATAKTDSLTISIGGGKGVKDTDDRMGEERFEEGRSGSCLTTETITKILEKQNDTTLEKQLTDATKTFTDAWLKNNPTLTDITYTRPTGEVIKAPINDQKQLKELIRLVMLDELKKLPENDTSQIVRITLDNAGNINTNPLLLYGDLINNDTSNIETTGLHYQEPTKPTTEVEQETKLAQGIQELGAPLTNEGFAQYLQTGASKDTLLVPDQKIPEGFMPQAPIEYRLDGKEPPIKLTTAADVNAFIAKDNDRFKLISINGVYAIIDMNQVNLDRANPANEEKIEAFCQPFEIKDAPPPPGSTGTPGAIKEGKQAPSGDLRSFIGRQPTAGVKADLNTTKYLVSNIDILLPGLTFNGKPLSESLPGDKGRALYTLSVMLNEKTNSFEICLDFYPTANTSQATNHDYYTLSGSNVDTLVRTQLILDPRHINNKDNPQQDIPNQAPITSSNDPRLSAPELYFQNHLSQIFGSDQYSKLTATTVQAPFNYPTKILDDVKTILDKVHASMSPEYYNKIRDYVINRIMATTNAHIGQDDPVKIALTAVIKELAVYPATTDNQKI